MGISLSTGDLNIYHARWLRHSNGNSIQGADLKVVCDNFCLQQLVRDPTREQYLLDLYLTDIPATKSKVGPYIADHRMLLATLPLPETQTLQISRQRFNVRKANWDALTNALVSTDWSAIDRGTANNAVTYCWVCCVCLFGLFAPS